MDVPFKSKTLWTGEDVQSLLTNFHLWIMLFLILLFSLSYYIDVYYLQHNVEWLWYFRVFEFKYHFFGIPLYIPMIYATLIFGWVGVIVAWLLSFILILPQIVYFSSYFSALLNNVMLLTAPAMAICLAVLIYRRVQTTKKILIDREIERQAYMMQILKAHEDERKSIARELHDDSIQTLVAIANRLEDFIHKDKENTLSCETRSLLSLSRDMVFRVSEDLRRLSTNLRPSILDDLGLIEALRSLVDSFNVSVFATKLMVIGENRKLPSETDVIVFRFVQEALNNAKRHSGASKTEVEIRFGRDLITVKVQDNGQGFVLPKPIGQLTALNKFGIVGMQERARMLNGTFEINSQPGTGTTVSLEFKA